MLGVCKECGKVIYEGNEAEGITPLTCKSCYEQAVERKLRLERQKAEQARKEAERQKRERAEKEERRRVEIRRGRNRGLIWGGVIGCLVFMISFIDAVKAGSFGDVLFALLFGAVLFTYVSQLFWEGAVLDCTLAGGKVLGTPGIIFTFDLDGFIFLIAMKILFAVLRLLFWVFTVVVCALAGIIISPFTFVPALLRVNSGDLV